MDQFKGQVKLPVFAVPKSYDLTLKPDLTACTFSGTVVISVDIVEETKLIVLNSLDLVIDGSSVHFSDHQKQFRPSNILLFKEDEILVLGFDEVLPVTKGTLSISFSGILNDDMKGFYRSTHVVNGEKRNIAVTQFEAVDARRCFPCWDEPALKATFKITVEVPSDMITLSNMTIAEEKLDGDRKIVYFDESPIMSTYLVAIVVGLFDHIEDTSADGTKVCVYCPLGKSNQGKFALDVAVKVLPLYKDYFLMPYPLPKLDMVAVPDFASGAMENYGLVTYRDTALLYDENHCEASNKQWIAIVVAHELAHQWFGNLVTMEWWTHLWLNEGFATWVSYLAIDALFPEWKVWTQFLGQTTAQGLRLDSLAESHPIEVEVPHARAVDEIFDAISYNKGASMIRMLQDYLGADIFQRSLASYVTRYAWKNARTEDLWGVLSEESGIAVNKLMDSWTKQKGYPVITVKSKNHALEFEQVHFLSSGSIGNGQWVVPLTLYLGPDKNRSSYLLEEKVGQMDISGLLHSQDRNIQCENKNVDVWENEQYWVKVNAEQTGFYRVKYDDKLSVKLLAAVKANLLSTADKFGILDDCYALCEACQQPLSSLLSVMDVYREEVDYIIVSRLIYIITKVVKISTDAIPDFLKELKQIFISLLLFSADTLGWDAVSGENHLNALLRGEVLTALARLDHDKTQKEAQRRFHVFLNDRNTSLLPADTKKAAYIAVMRSASPTNRSDFDSLLNVYRETDLGQEKARILSSVASCPDPDVVLEVLNFMLSPEVRGQDMIYGLAGLSLEGRETAWTWLKENWDLISSRWGSGMLLTQFISSIVTPFSSDEKAEEISAFFSSQVMPSITMTLKQSIEQVRINAKWVCNIRNEHSLEKVVKALACGNWK
ncbi:aminopeptidase M1-like [Aristolochia californica]|uniref:aminopeptidase M1-like n=1 Tax=Aristolochia californica TaxID=171875 RepID=UPI0035E047F7